MDYLIRPAQLSDATGIAVIQVDSYRTAYAPFFPSAYIEHFTYDDQEQDWRELLSMDNHEKVYVAVSQDDQVFGYVLLRLTTDCYPGYNSEIVGLHVGVLFQGRGIGGRLLSAAAHALQIFGAHNTMLWTLQGNPVRAWYERLGGQYLGEQRFMVDEIEIVEVAYGWSNLDRLFSIGRNSHV